MSPEKNSSKAKLCPVCGTRLSADATKCPVCGTELDAKADTKKQSEVRAKRLPEITLSLPAALGLLALFITLGAVAVFLIINNQESPPEVGDVTSEVGTATPSPTITITPTVTQTPTEAPTWTPLPPIEYTVKPGDVCASIAAAFNVSVQSIILENNLSADCNLLEDQVLMIPQPTPTASPQPTETLSEAEKTEEACEKVYYTVEENDTLSSIADTYNVSMATIREYNSLPSDTVLEDQVLIIPLCMREPTAGPTPTPTTLPPYPGPNLLLPADGASFTAEMETITLQWAAVSELQSNEAYAVTITDLTSENNLTETFYVTETSYIVPASFSPNDGRPHVYRWYVYIVRQLGTDEENDENWEAAGDKSEERVFSWYSTAGPQPTATIE
jgi:LysM repeat protein/ribosomal protein L40E